MRSRKEAGRLPEERVEPRTRTAAGPAVPRHRRLAGPLLALLTVLTWSTYSVASSLGAAQGFRPWDMTLLRFAGGALLVLRFLPRRRIADLDGLGWRRGVGLALAGGPLFGLTVYYYRVMNCWPRVVARSPAGSRGSAAGGASARPRGAGARSRSRPGCAAPGAREEPRGR